LLFSLVLDEQEFEFDISNSKINVQDMSDRLEKDVREKMGVLRKVILQTFNDVKASKDLA
jgi:hypothetical protein